MQQYRWVVRQSIVSRRLPRPWDSEEWTAVALLWNPTSMASLSLDYRKMTTMTLPVRTASLLAEETWSSWQHTQGFSTTSGTVAGFVSFKISLAVRKKILCPKFFVQTCKIWCWKPPFSWNLGTYLNFWAPVASEICSCFFFWKLQLPAMLTFLIHDAVDYCSAGPSFSLRLLLYHDY